jgi:hypothetical protein
MYQARLKLIDSRVFTGILRKDGRKDERKDGRTDGRMVALLYPAVTSLPGDN